MRAVALMLVVLGCAGCGAVDDAVDDVKREARKVEETVKEESRKLRAEADRLRDRVKKRVNTVLAKIKRAVPRADEATVVPSRASASSFAGFMGSVHANVDRYWRRTFAAADLERPRVARRFIAPGDEVRTDCNQTADDVAAFYCPADDTIYIGEAIGRQILDNIGDFGVAYVVAHEYAHNVQQELGWFESGARLTTVAPFELQADCMSGAWAYSVYQEGRLDEGDVEEAVDTAFAVGDFDTTNPQHHGTPEQRAAAWQRGYETGDPSVCRGFTPA